MRADLKAYASGQVVRWCPGCGDYAILKAMQRALAELNAPTEKTVFVSGIGCAARFPYYMSTYGLHTIHGRAPAFATGVKLANPDLDVWIVAGDGDGLSIGGNHLLHVLRRNLDVQILLFNNEIYGLTKGQFSPTSRRGTLAPSAPGGSTDEPVNAARFALGAKASFVARGVDTHKGLPELLKEAKSHRGASFVEIFQNCPIYNDGIFSGFTDKEVAADRQLHVRHGEPLRFGGDLEKGLRIAESGKLEVVSLADGASEGDVAVHDETDSSLAWRLAGLAPPDFPMAMGVLHRSVRRTHEEDAGVSSRAQEGASPGEDRFAAIEGAIRSKGTWSVGPAEGEER